MKEFKEIISAIRKLIGGFRVYGKKKETPFVSYLSMRYLFCVTKGLSNDLSHFLLTSVFSKRKFDSKKGILGKFNKKEKKNILNELKEKGYYVLDQILDKETIDNLTEFALRGKTHIVPLGEDDSRVLPKAPIDFKNLLGIRYLLNSDELVNEPSVQKIMSDESMMSIAQDYLGSVPISTGVVMWWNTDYLPEPNDNAATMWHFDMDNLKWLNFFFYLSDIDENKGPHCFVEGTHKSRSMPDLFYQDKRKTDLEVSSHFAPDKIKEFIAKKGTLIIEDTRGLHKGKHVLSGSRLLFQVRFTSHLFGAVPEKAVIKRFANEETEKFIKSNAVAFQSYL
ncbi:phytanoyl-CoA dioxygenase family protein [Leptospira sp. 'Mane']|uniref:phytanoyl-CoA dioxygenase family protein n=1 Tax=Leptospira sp. 'Mane' TaxID=3387407 RepID=UPI00398A9F9A